MRSNKTLKVIGYVVGALILCEIVILEFFSHDAYAPKYSFSSPTDYTDLFNDSAKHKTVLDVTNLIKGRSPISEYTYDHRYQVMVYRMDVPSSFSISTVNKTRFPKPAMSLVKSYGILNAGNFDIYYPHDSVLQVNNLNISYLGKTASNIFKNDSISCAKIILDKMFVQYNGMTNPCLIIQKHDPSSESLPTASILIKRRNYLCFVFLSPSSKGDFPIDDVPKAILNETFIKSILR